MTPSRGQINDLTSPRSVMSTLAGVMSRCTIPLKRAAVGGGELVRVREALADSGRDVDGGLDREGTPILLVVVDDVLESKTRM